MDVLDALLDPWRSGIDRRALIEVILVGAFCGGLGFWVVSERLSYGAESLAHGLLPGLVLAALASAPLLLGALGGVAAAAVLIALASRDERIGPDTAVAVVVTGLVGLGALLALTPDAPQRLQELLFGDPLGVTDGDLLAALALTLLGGAGAGRAPPPAHRYQLRRRRSRPRRRAPELRSGWRCSACWRSPSRSPSRASARCWCSPCWSRRPSPYVAGSPRPAARSGPARWSARSPASPASTSPCTPAWPPAPRSRSRSAPRQA